MDRSIAAELPPGNRNIVGSFHFLTGPGWRKTVAMTAPTDSPAAPARDVAFFVLPRFNMLTLAAALEPLRAANYLAAAPLYGWHYVSATGGTVSASNGIAVETTAYPSLKQPPDMLVLAASWGADHFHAPEVFAWLRRLERQGASLIGLEMAVHILARAGLLGEGKATTHWSCLPAFAERYPHVQADEAAPAWPVSFAQKRPGIKPPRASGSRQKPA